ncbi:uncharacterized protein EDB91DRAFT_1348264 [Suillus paluster]|uniref:uncharacterized protein n=1 Tax=Suillus paluster TaxID=48578 RepID=UPI001B85B7E0|nr:uncharacterized protein EDB91DRAFT_1348264 [Suillus paluster]KAG1735596.1 hypothetical protein EDB91DRAFT_1348264 [Suillus paluster]
MTSSSFGGSQAATPTNKSNRSCSVAVENGDAEDAHSFQVPLGNETKPRSIESKEGSPRGGSSRLHKNWNPEFRKVIQPGILEVKVYVTFTHGYPEIMAPIEMQMRTDDDYLSALANLIDARASFFRTDIKDVACKNTPDYFRLGRDCDTILDRLLANHSYHFPQSFDAQGLPSPNRQKPYQGQPVFHVTYEIFFKNAKSVGLQFAQHFLDIAKNKADRLEIPIPMLAIVCTAIGFAVFTLTCSLTFFVARFTPVSWQRKRSRAMISSSLVISFVISIHTTCHCWKNGARQVSQDDDGYIRGSPALRL